MRWQSWIRDGWLGEQLGLKARPRRREDGLVRGWRVRRLEDRRVLSVTGVDAGADVGPVNEGTQVALSGVTFTDDNPANTHTATINWGDGTITVGTVTEPSGGAGAVNGTHTYADNGVYTVTITVLGVDASTMNDSFQITIQNVAPTLTVVADRNANEGANVSITDIGTFSDPGFNNPTNPVPGGETQETFTFTINWGDGTSNSAGSATVDTAGSAGNLTLGSFNGSHTYADNGVYTVTVTVFDDDGGSDQKTFTITVSNVAPTLTVVADRNANEGANVNITDIGTFTDPGFNNPLNPIPGGETTETFTFTINWGDGTTNSAGSATIDTTGSAGTPTGGSFNGTHTYADDGVYTVTVTVFDDDGGSDQKTFTITVANVAPTLTVVADRNANEGANVTITDIGTFSDPGYNNPLNPLPGGETTETFTYTINWGDGTSNSAGSATIDTTGSAGTPTGGSFNGSHTYADNGVYTVTVTVFDDDSGSHQQTFTITVANVAPTLTVVADRNANEGANVNITDIGTFTDPGYNNPLNPIPGGETTETFTYTIDWGDGTTNSAGSATIDTTGSAGTPTGGSFNGSHTYADNGVYTVTVTITDDDGGSDQKIFTITVANVAPTLTVVADRNANEGANVNITDIGTFTDPGFNNPLNPIPGGETTETITYTIDWGDGTTNSAGTATIDTTGSAGTPTAGSFNGSHVYADNGVYTVTVTITDDDGGTDQKTFTITVANVAPTLTAIGNQTTNEGTNVNLTNIGTFTDPGFNNPLNPIPGGETTETFTYTINWGDGTGGSGGSATIDTAGSPGTPTAGSFDGSHTYADDGVYTVTLTIFDDDGGSHQQTFTVTVNNVAPTLTVVANQNTTENAQINITDIGTFTDPGFNNPLNPIPGGETTETFTYTIDWGDNSVDSAGSATVDTLGSAGVLTAGSFDGTHTYASGGNFTVTVTVFDDDGGSHVRTFQINVASVPPVLSVVSDQSTNEGTNLNLSPIGTFTNPDPTATHTATINWGDGTTTAGVISEAGGSGSISGQHTYADNGIYIVTVTVFDDDLDSDAKTFQVTVVNVSPTVVSTPSSGDEGTVINISFTDPGFDNPSNPAPGETTETFTYNVDWGDGSAVEAGSVSNVTSGSAGVLTIGSLSHIYADNGVYNVTVTIFDDDGGGGGAIVQIIVANVAPTLSTGANQVSDEGAIANVPGLTMFDQGTLDTHTAIIDWGDGTSDFGFVSESPYGPPGSLAGLSGTVFGGHYYADNGVYTVTVRVYDDDGGMASSVFQVTVNNVAPTFIQTAQVVGDEGQLLTLPLLALFTDPGYDNPNNPLVPGGSTESFRFIINWGDGSPPTPLTLAAIQSAGGPGGFLSLGSIFGAHTFADNGVYHVTITVFDDDGGSAQAELDLVINNVAPIITNLIPEDISADSVGNLSGAFADPGADSWTITIVWGDGEPDTIVFISQGGIQSFQSTHQYFGPPNPNDPAAPIPISITIDDGDGGVVTVATEFQVPGTGLVAAIALPTPSAPSLIGLGQAARVEGAPQIRGADSASNQATSDNAAGGDAGAEENVREIVLRVISPIGELVRDPRTGRVKELLLTEAQLKDLRDFFRIWPDGHYRIDLREGKAERLIIEVYVREGEMVDPADIEELNAPADAAPVETPPENSARATEIPDAAWENWQPRRQAAAPSSSDAEANRTIDEPAELNSAVLGEVLGAGLASELLRERARRVDDATSRTTRGWQRRRLRDVARTPQKP